MFFYKLVILLDTNHVTFSLEWKREKWKFLCMYWISAKVHARFIIQSSNSYNFVKNKRNLNLKKGF